MRLGFDARGDFDRGGCLYASFSNLKVEERCHAREDGEWHRHHEENAPKVAAHESIVLTIRKGVLASRTRFAQ